MHLSRLKHSAAGLDENSLLAPGIDQSIQGNGESGWLGNRQLDIDKHVGPESKAWIVRLEAEFQSSRGRIDLGQDVADPSRERPLRICQGHASDRTRVEVLNFGIEHISDNP